MILSGVEIREAVAGDEQVLARLDRETWSPSHAVMPRPEPGQEFFDERHVPAHYLVAETEDLGVVGYVRVGSSTPLACNAHVRQIQGLAVDPAARGRGVARALMRAAGERARGEGATRLTLRVLGHNAPARALYASEGFAVEGVLPGEFLLDGEYVDDILMGRAL
ncbi:GNAT family N-acetyltransferase [Streptomyces laurentii]